ncbi:DUF7344 domain-containing protein [Halopiger xanaduensis]|uniref:DUF7344 domain-containing protein n=1 Tax=Halopiger xanaduensis (strain DSM 18323 / JCM 14033 / SH-6) TaxID=797210 RepID=F8D6F9_HALXS|nr:hypothetical protein [Halopiger xanaduensis]AEH36546.1 hypothetical protein Halxa_1919 [Halopiger xanaduensis SH-6]
MSSDAHLGDTSERDPLYDVPPEQYEACSHPRRVYLLEILTSDTDGERGDDRHSLFDLTTELIEREEPDVPNGQARHEVRLSLLHNHLPRLADCGVIEWDAETGVELVAEPQLCPAALASLLEETPDDETDTPADDELLQRVVDPSRLRVARLVHESDGSLSLDRLATALAARDSLAPAETETAKIELHHAHLPALDAVGVLEYDPDAGLVDATPMTDAVSFIP